jgi:hypothetical protein
MNRRSTRKEVYYNVTLKDKDSNENLSLTSKNHNNVGNHAAKVEKSNHQIISPLLPKFVDAHIQHQGRPQNSIKAGRVQVKDPWITESLTDQILQCIIQIKEEEEQTSSSSSSSLSLLYGRKYINQAVRLIANWSKIEETNLKHEFVFYLSEIVANHDYGRRLVAELIDLGNTAPSTLNYLLHEVVKRLFAMVSALWFYRSAAEEIEVRLMP